jgi:multidrug efflux system outer membrane protein
LLASGWARAATEWSLTAQVAEAYFGLVAVDRQIEISETVLAGRAAAVRLRQREREAGAGNEFDLRRAEAELAETAATIASLAQQRAVLERSVTALLGRTPNEIAAGRLARGVLDESKPWAAVLPQGAAADLLAQRPDVREVEALLAAANANIEAARAAALPSLRLSGVLGSDARSIADLFSGPSIFWSLAASLTQSIFDGGKVDAQVRISRAQAEQLLARYRKSIAAAVLDVREAYVLLDLTEQAYRAEHQRVVALERARELARIGFDAGAFTYLDLLDAERNWYQSLLQQVAAHRDQRIGQVAAFKALGGGYAGAPQIL